MRTSPRPLLLGYSSAVVSIALAAWVRVGLDPVLGRHFPFSLFYAALLFTAWYGGKGPALFATLLGLGLTYLLFPPPEDASGQLRAEYFIGVCLYCLVGLLSIFLSESLHRARQRAEAGASEARRQQATLEHEVAERKRLEGELRRRAGELDEAHRRKDEFLAMLAHELRNPLAPVRNGLHIIKQLGIQGTPLERVQEIMERQVELLTHLVDDLLDVSRIAHGKIRLRKEKVNLAAVVKQAVETCRPLLDQHRHELTVALPPQPLHLEADATRLEQILINLLTNAAKYTPEGGQVWLTAGAEDGEVVLRVRDTGKGIPAEMLPRLFEPFQHSDWVSGSARAGLGIGLTLVRRLTELHGGRVEVFSAGVDKGSEFVVRLPALPPEEARQHPRGDIETVTVPPKRRILIVDDNEDVGRSLAMMLRLQGHEVRVAQDGPGALDIARTDPPQLVLLDLGMPGMDGYEVARRLRDLPGLEGVVLAALTGWAQEADRERTREAGFDAHLVKPVDPNQLQQLLALRETAAPAHS